MKRGMLILTSILYLVAVTIQSCTKGGKETPAVTPPPKDTISTQPPKDTTATTPPKNDTTRAVRVIDELTFYDVSDHSMGEVDIANDLFWGHVYMDDPNGNITFLFVPADSADVAEAIQTDKTQGWVFLKYHHVYPYSVTDTAFTLERAKLYDRLIATTNDKATGKVHQDVYVIMQPWYTTVPAPIYFSVRDFKVADLPKSTGALFQKDIQVLRYNMAK